MDFYSFLDFPFCGNDTLAPAMGEASCFIRLKCYSNDFVLLARGAESSKPSGQEDIGPPERLCGNG
jgi:hypothetical protein